MKQKLIELIDEGDNNCVGTDCFDCPYMGKANCLEAMIADHLIANGVTIQKWIPVSERLPEIVSTNKRYRSTIKKSIRVLCVCVQKSGKTMVKEGYCEWYNDYPEPRWQIPGTIDSVTHWMPLPEPPKGE